MRWRPEHLAFLRAWFPKLRIAALTERFNREYGLSLRPSQVRNYLKKNKIRSGRPRGFAKGERRMLTAEQHAFLAEQFPRLSRKALAEAMNQRFGLSLNFIQIANYAKRYGIRSGRTGQFEPGLRPWNTGLKGVIHRNRTTFRKGNVPGNTREIGAERVDDEGYIWIKTAQRNPYTGAPTRFQLKHAAVWEAANGPVPKGHALRFIDGDKSNCALENLELVSLAENLHLNRIGYANAPAEARKTAMLLARVEVKAFQRKRQAKEEAQP